MSWREPRLVGGRSHLAGSVFLSGQVGHLTPTGTSPSLFTLTSKSLVDLTLSHRGRGIIRFSLPWREGDRGRGSVLWESLFRLDKKARHSYNADL